MEKSLPKHIALIMDGNRSWAKAKNLPSLEGHRRGAEALQKTIDNVRKAGIKYMSVFALSTENWNRGDEEIKYLMDLTREWSKKVNLEKLNKENIRFIWLGNREESRIPQDLKDIASDVEEKTKDNDGFCFGICFSYGGREEIVNAIKKIPVDKIQSLTEEELSSYLYSKDMPDPDLIVRTSGKIRTSNFLMWQSAYAEWYFTDTKWPDFDEKALNKALEEYANRTRTFGGD